MADTYKTIKCPACGSVMKKIFVPSAGINVDICADGCGSMFFDNQELQQFNKASDDISEIKKVLEGKSFTPVDVNETRICPACGKSMVKTRIKGLKVQIDTCYTCGGIFLDHGELDIIRQGVRKTTVNDLKIQNGMIDENTIRTFYKEFQQEELMKNRRNEMMGDVLFGCGSEQSFSRRRYGLLDFIFSLLF